MGRSTPAIQKIFTTHSVALADVGTAAGTRWEDSNVIRNRNCLLIQRRSYGLPAAATITRGNRGSSLFPEIF